MATSVIDNVQHDDIQRAEPVWRRLTVGWPSLTRAEALWSIVGLMLLVTYLFLALASG